jgi:hypothetical protein
MSNELEKMWLVDSRAKPRIQWGQYNTSVKFQALTVASMKMTVIWAHASVIALMMEAESTSET